MKKKKSTLYNEFHTEVDEALNLVKTFYGLKSKLDKKYAFSIAELALLKIEAAWEQYLEDTFIEMIVSGKKTRSKRSFSYVKPMNRDIVRKIIYQGRDYSKWDYDDVQRKAIIYFKNGEPFMSGLRSVGQELKEITDVRNRIAHRSLHSEKQFKTVIQKRIGYVPKLTPGEFLLTFTGKNNDTYLAFYANILLNAGKRIHS